MHVMDVQTPQPPLSRKSGLELREDLLVRPKLTQVVEFEKTGSSLILMMGLR